MDMFWYAPWNETAYNLNCTYKYGLYPRPKWILQQFGGLFGAGGNNLAGYSNIVFSNGELDPWSGGGVLTNVSVESNLVAITYYGAHHLDLRAAMPMYDPQSVVDARNIERHYIRVFLGQYPPTGINNKQIAGLTILVTVIVTVLLYIGYGQFMKANKPVKSMNDVATIAVHQPVSAGEGHDHKHEDSKNAHSSAAVEGVVKQAVRAGLEGAAAIQSADLTNGQPVALSAQLSVNTPTSANAPRT